MTGRVKLTEAQIYRKAMTDARVVMGRDDKPRRRSDPMKNSWNADSDPAAWWELVELFVGYYRAGRAALEGMK